MEAEAKRLHAEADGLIRSMYTGQVAWSARERAFDAKLRAAFASVRGDAGASAAFHRLVYGLERRSPLLGIEPILPSRGPQPGNTGLDALLHLARFQNRWIDAPEGWTPGTGDARGQLGSLARRLFARYPLPVFLDAAWLSGCSEPAEAQREWFVHLGAGGRLEAIPFPLPMTHRAAHHFLLAPAEFTIAAAMRYGQIRALGGREALARALAQTFLSEVQKDEAFWLSFVHLLVNHPALPASQVGPLADFVRYRRFGPGEDGGPEPRFSLKGRTAEALLKRMEEWHETLGRLGRKARQTWSPSGIAPLDRAEKDRLSPATCHWRILEITDSLGLLEEGREMRHCVRTYQDACVKGVASIWSLRLALSDDPAVRRLLTIEVNSHRRAIVQVRGKCNRTLPSLRGNQRMMLARDVLKDWAREQHLGIACPL